MSDRDALLAAIRANPDEDTPRLAFADWLDKHEPDAKPRAAKGKLASLSPSSWASLIRAECEFERLRDDGSAAAAVYDFFAKNDENTFDAVRWERVLPEMRRRVELLRLIPALRRASAKARAVGRPKPTPAARWIDTTHRSFPAHVVVGYSPRWVRRLPEWGACYPRVTVECDYNDSLEDVDTLIAAGFARWCRGLMINANENHARLINAMSRSPDTAGVHELRIGWSSSDHMSRILADIADSPHWSGLRELTINSSFHVPPELIRRFFAAPALRELRRLSIGGAGLPEVAAALKGLKELRTLSLTNADLEDEGAEALARMPSLSKLRWLDVSFNQITGRGASALLASPHLKSLVALDFEGNPLRRLDSKLLADAPAGGLRVLGMQSARLTATDITTITTSPRASELMFFSSCYNPLPESALTRLVKGFGTRAPAVLYFMGNNVATEGARTLANWPAAEQIDMLHLSGNKITVPGARHIAGCTHLRQLNHLCADVSHASARTILKKQFGNRAVV